MSAPRGQFSSKFGFVMAASGSAVGLGNIWGFPTQTASNGGAAFVAVYLILAFLLAYPALMAELVIGRHARANIVNALSNLDERPAVRTAGAAVGYYGVIVASLILSFYTIIAGWMLAYFAEPITSTLGLSAATEWLVNDSLSRNLITGGIFASLTLWIIGTGIENGIERWSRRLMPSLLTLFLLLIGYVLFQPSAMAGLKIYLIPDFSKVFHPELILSAMGQAFFSLSLGVGTMLIYGSYIPRSENLPALGALVTLVDIGVAFLAGLLILPAIFVAQSYGVEIYQAGQFIGGPDLIFQVLPGLFDSMGSAGHVFAVMFFLLMTIAALTSSISMLEVPTTWLMESTPLTRTVSTAISAGLIFLLTSCIVIWFKPLFGWVVTGATEYSEPFMGIVLCLFAGWGIHRNKLLAELASGYPEIAQSIFWRIWPVYVRLVCPLLIAAVFLNSLV